MKIGITERGDPSLDFSWIARLKTVDGAIILTKNLSEKVRAAILEAPVPVIVHATCTGYGGTKVEPHVPTPATQVGNIRLLLNAGFPASRVVLRVDPIIPTLRGAEKFDTLLHFTAHAIPEVQRCRISILDTYPHTTRRFAEAGLTLNLPPLSEQVERVNAVLLNHPEYNFECCAEPLLNAEQIGCVSGKDLKLMSLPEVPYQKGTQRPTCLCASYKTELLSKCKQCAHGCLYCYWH